MAKEKEVSREELVKNFQEKTKRHQRLIILPVEKVEEFLENELVIPNPDPEGPEAAEAVHYHVTFMSSHVGKDGNEKIALLLTKSF